MPCEMHSDFWVRTGLRDADATTCLEAVRRECLGRHVFPFEEQGYCSFTLSVTAHNLTLGISKSTEPQEEQAGETRDAVPTLVQLRPPQHALNLDIMRAAKKMYPNLTTKINLLNLTLPGGLQAYEMERLPGVPLERVLPRHRSLSAEELAKLERFMKNLASVLAQSWQSSSKSPLPSRNIRADSPMAMEPAMLSHCTGRVGSSIEKRLRLLAEKLPDEWNRDVALRVLECVRSMTDYPVVITHGDLIATNILVSPSTWEITGLIDWAEAEYLPFGTCLYSLENFLGHLESDSMVKFVYYDKAPQLRAIFWNHLLEEIPDLMKRREEIDAVRDLGVLLWYGIAWDGGAIDRVVSEIEDRETLVYLRAFLRRGRQSP